MNFQKMKKEEGMGKKEDILLSKSPQIFFNSSSEITLENFKEDLLIPFIVKKIREEESQ